LGPERLDLSRRTCRRGDATTLARTHAIIIGANIRLIRFGIECGLQHSAAFIKTAPLNGSASKRKMWPIYS
jgi:hypothetical protein